MSDAIFDPRPFNPTERFSGLAAGYARYRPGYPDEAIDFILTHCDLRPRMVVADVGSGTGISSRLLAARGLAVIGIEPNSDMRAQAAAEPCGTAETRVEYREGRAEATGLPNEYLHAVFAAQAFHWFDPAQSLIEFRRILQPGGWVILLWNERDETDGFTADYGGVFRSIPAAAAIEGPRGQAGRAFLQSTLFVDQKEVSFPNTQLLDLDGLLGRAFSASYAPREPAEAQAFARAIQELHHRHQREGKVCLCYVTSLFVGRRP